MIDVLANEMNFDMRRWSDRALGENGSSFNTTHDSSYSSNNYKSQYVSHLADFKSFLLRAQAYTPLKLFHTTTTGDNADKHPLILIEELPRIGENMYSSKRTQENILKLQVMY